MQVEVYFTTMGLERIVGLGVDIIEVGRITADFQELPAFAEEFCSEEELAIWNEASDCTKTQLIADSFSAKEAVIKALGGEGDRGDEPELDWREIIIRREENSRPCVELIGRAKNRAEDVGVESLSLTFSSIRDVPIAICVAYGKRA